MSKFFYRAALAAIAFTLLLPLGAMAQEAQGQTNPPPSNGQVDGSQRRGQWARRGGRGQNQHIQMLAQKLNLTDEQKQQFQQIGQQMASTKKPGNTDDDDPFAGMTSDDDGPGGF